MPLHHLKKEKHENQAKYFLPDFHAFTSILFGKLLSLLSQRLFLLFTTHN